MYKECKCYKNQNDRTKPAEQKKSFAELFDNFCAKYGADWANNPEGSEPCADAFVDYLKSQSSQVFDYEKVNNLK
jgi:hypothetical protein